MNESLVIIPTYNESENIRAITQAVFDVGGFDVLIVDDNSPDGTADIVRELQEQYNGLHLEVRKEKSGLGTAYIHGFKWALAREYQYILEMDADFSHNPKDLPRLVEKAKSGCDLVIGSRYSKGVNVVNWPMYRVLLSYGASKYVQMVLGMNVSDATAGFVCYTRECLESMDFDKIRFVGYGFQIEMKYYAYRLGKKICEVSIVFTDRTKGESKMDKGIIREAIWGILRLRFQRFD